MPFAEHFSLTGITTVTQTGTLPTRIKINTGFQPTRIEIMNATQFGQTGTGNLNIQKMGWNYLTPSITYVEYINAAGTAILPGVVTASAGISVYDGSQSVLYGPQITGTTITQASPAVATAAAHGLQTGDIVLFTNNTNMKQLGGLLFKVTVINANSFSINIDASGFSAAETSFRVSRLLVGPLYYPQALTIVAITKAAQAVVTTSTEHGLTVGQKVRIRVPTGYGMTQINDLLTVISAVTATTFTCQDINSLAFTTFVYPAAGGGGFVANSPPQVVPIGSGPYPVATPPFWADDTLLDATSNIQYDGFIIGPGVLLTSTNVVIGITANDLLLWTAYRDDV